MTVGFITGLKHNWPLTKFENHEPPGFSIGIMAHPCRAIESGSCAEPSDTGLLNLKQIKPDTFFLKLHLWFIGKRLKLTSTYTFNHTHNLGAIRTLIDRNDSVVSEEEDRMTKEAHIREALKKCGYTEWTVRKVKEGMAAKKGKKKKEKENAKC